MERRSFLQRSATAAGVLFSGSIAQGMARPPGNIISEKHEFKLKYAPHFGMFKHHAGDDPLDQLQWYTIKQRGFDAYLGMNAVERRLHAH